MVMPGVGAERRGSLDGNPLADQTPQRARQRRIRARVIRQELNAIEALARVEEIISDRASGGVQREDVGGLARVPFPNVLEIRRTWKDFMAQRPLKDKRSVSFTSMHAAFAAQPTHIVDMKTDAAEENISFWSVAAVLRRR